MSVLHHMSYIMILFTKKAILAFSFICSNLVVNAIREIYGSESSLFVPLLQWCGELMQYYRQRLLDEMKEILPVTRFYIALEVTHPFSV